MTAAEVFIYYILFTDAFPVCDLHNIEDDYYHITGTILYQPVDYFNLI